MNCTSIVIKNYRSFNEDGLELDLSSGLVVLIGRNNSGKTNALRLLKMLGDATWPTGLDATKMQIALSGEDVHGQDATKNIEVTVKFTINLEELKIDADRLQRFTFFNQDQKEYFITYSVRPVPESDAQATITNSPIHGASGDLLERYSLKFLGSSKGNAAANFPQVWNDLQLWRELHLPTVISMDEFRKLQGDEAIRAELGKLINLTSTTREEFKPKQEALHDFIRDVSGMNLLVLLPDPSKDVEIELVDKNTQRQITFLGTGIQQIILLALRLVLADDALICIDEPELHLHPAAQRALLRYITRNKNHTYVLTTHSNSFLDYEVDRRTIYHFRHDGESTTALKVSNIEQLRNITSDLGIRASELMQTNGIIWVEGPSDRIYIKRWIELTESSPKEGLDYTFEYYGGRLLSHYTADESATNDFVELLLINKNAFVVMDRDVPKKGKLTAAKERVRSECKAAKIGCWVTHGREIENYLSNRLLTRHADADVKRNAKKKIETYAPNYNREKKVKFARAICERMDKTELENNFDLRGWIERLVEDIQRWKE